MIGQPVRQSIGNSWLDHKPVRSAGMVKPEPVNPGTMDWWITNRIPFNVANPPEGNTGSMDWWITDRIPLNIWAGRP